VYTWMTVALQDSNQASSEARVVRITFASGYAARSSGVNSVGIGP